MKLIFLHRQDVNVLRFTCIRAIIFGGILSLCLHGGLWAQVSFEQTAPRRYYIEFTDKNNNQYSLSDPGAFLSAKAIARRNNQNIAFVENDLPVTRAYIDSILVTGARVLNVSKWFNAVTVVADSDIILNRIAKYNFVRKSTFLKSGVIPVRKLAGGIQTVNTTSGFDYGVSGWQTAIHKGNVLHS